MYKIKHRVNSLEELNNTPLNLGVEIDIRTNNNELILHHDPFEKGELFIKWIEAYKHKIIVLNVKEEGLETELLEIMQKKNIKNFFFLDQSFPFLIKTINLGEKRCAVVIHFWRHGYYFLLCRWESHAASPPGRNSMQGSGHESGVIQLSWETIVE